MNLSPRWVQAPGRSGAELFTQFSTGNRTDMISYLPGIHQGSISDERRIALADKHKSNAEHLLSNSFTCQVDFTNLMTDGSYISGIVAQFTYEDHSQSTSNNPNVDIQYNQIASLYSEDKCVTDIVGTMAVRRPDGSVQIVSSDSGPAPVDKCIINEEFGVEPSAHIAKEDRGKRMPRPIRVTKKSAAN